MPALCRLPLGAGHRRHPVRDTNGARPFPPQIALRVGPFKKVFDAKPEANDAIERIVTRQGQDYLEGRRKLPFFNIIYVDDEIVVARGRSGGLAFWARASPSWQLANGIEGVETAN